VAPEVRKGQWTEEEDAIILQAHAKIGNKWTEISKRLVGRPANSVKNHWNSTLRKTVQTKKRKRDSDDPKVIFAKRNRQTVEGKTLNEKEQEHEQNSNTTHVYNRDQQSAENVKVLNEDSGDDCEKNTFIDSEEQTSDSKQLESSTSIIDQNPMTDLDCNKVDVQSESDVLSSDGCDSPQTKPGTAKNTSTSPHAGDEDLDMWYEVCVSYILAEQPWSGGYLEEFFSTL